MKFNIVIEVENCPYKGKKEHFDAGNRMFYKCKCEAGFGECYMNCSTFKELCPLVLAGCLIP